MHESCQPGAGWRATFVVKHNEFQQFHLQTSLPPACLQPASSLQPEPASQECQPGVKPGVMPVRSYASQELCQSGVTPAMFSCQCLYVLPLCLAVAARGAVVAPVCFAVAVHVAAAVCAAVTVAAAVAAAVTVASCLCNSTSTGYCHFYSYC